MLLNQRVHCVTLGRVPAVPPQLNTKARTMSKPKPSGSAKSRKKKKDKSGSGGGGGSSGGGGDAIKVAVRVRPFNTRETAGSSKLCTECQFTLHSRTLLGCTEPHQCPISRSRTLLHGMPADVRKSDDS